MAGLAHLSALWTADNDGNDLNPPLSDEVTKLVSGNNRSHRFVPVLPSYVQSVSLLCASPVLKSNVWIADL